MKYYCWSWCGVNDWWLSLTAEAQAGWVSACGTVLAAAIAAWVYVGSNRRQEAQRNMDAAAQRDERARQQAQLAKQEESRQQAILDTVWYDLATAIGRVSDAVDGCRHLASGNGFDPVGAFVANSFSPEQKTLSDMRELIITVPDVMRTEISAAIGQLARYNTYLTTFAAWVTPETMIHLDVRSEHLKRIELEAIDVARRLLLIGLTIGRALGKSECDIEKHFGYLQPKVLAWVGEQQNK